jgi:hypothetical protein
MIRLPDSLMESAPDKILSKIYPFLSLNEHSNIRLLSKKFSNPSIYQVVIKSIDDLDYFVHNADKYTSLTNLELNFAGEEIVETRLLALVKPLENLTNLTSLTLYLAGNNIGDAVKTEIRARLSVSCFSCTVFLLIRHLRDGHYGSSLLKMQQFIKYDTNHNANDEEKNKEPKNQDKASSVDTSISCYEILLHRKYPIKNLLKKVVPETIRNMTFVD